MAAKQVIILSITILRHRADVSQNTTYTICLGVPVL
jgi:hypothetical protein